MRLLWPLITPGLAPPHTPPWLLQLRLLHPLHILFMYVSLAAIQRDEKFTCVIVNHRFLTSHFRESCRTHQSIAITVAARMRAKLSRNKVL